MLELGKCSDLVKIIGKGSGASVNTNDLEMLSGTLLNKKGQETSGVLAYIQLTVRPTHPDLGHFFSSYGSNHANCTV